MRARKDAPRSGLAALGCILSSLSSLPPTTTILAPRRSSEREEVSTSLGWRPRVTERDDEEARRTNTGCSPADAMDAMDADAAQAALAAAAEGEAGGLSEPQKADECD